MSDERDKSWETALQMQPSLWSDAALPEGTWITVLGDSMMPTVPAGTRVHVRAKPPRIGDVILFASARGDRAVLHRVLFCMPGWPWIVQAGDAHRQPGSAGVIHHRQVIGVADLPRRPPSPEQVWSAFGMFARGTLRRLRERTGSPRR